MLKGEEAWFSRMIIGLSYFGSVLLLVLCLLGRPVVVDAAATIRTRSIHNGRQEHYYYYYFYYYYYYYYYFLSLTVTIVLLVIERTQSRDSESGAYIQKETIELVRACDEERRITHTKESVEENEERESDLTQDGKTRANET